MDPAIRRRLEAAAMGRSSLPLAGKSEKQGDRIMNTIEMPLDK
jgi:hypothetical protein